MSTASSKARAANPQDSGACLTVSRGQLSSSDSLLGWVVYHTFEEQGVRHLMLNMQSDTVDASTARMDRFATAVKPLAA